MTPILFAAYTVADLVTDDSSLIVTDDGSRIDVSCTERSFNTQGLGALIDATSCIVTEERNGAFELEMKYPVTGKRYKDLKLSAIILAVPSYKSSAEPFRIYKISRPINGLVTVFAEHISYQLSCIPVVPFSASNVNAALAGLKNNSTEENPFTFSTDKTTSANFSVKVPSSLRSVLGGSSGSIIDVYGGEWKFNKYTCTLYASRGADNGVEIRYGKNLQDLKQDESIANTITGICPYWADMDGNTVTLPEISVYSSNRTSFPYNRTIVKDFSADFEERPTVEQLRAKANSYITQTGIGVPDVSLDVSFVSLAETEEYKNYALLERVNLCDIVHVIFDELGVNAAAKVTKTKYNVLADSYESISLGTIKASLSSTMTAMAQAQAESVSAQKAAIVNATNQITGVSGGHVVINRDANGEPYEILIMDTDDVTTAQKVWRWNQNGLGYSSDGYNGTYALAMTQDGKIVADFITTGNLNADIITTGSMSADHLGAGTITGNVIANNLTMRGGSISVTSDSSTFDFIKLMYQNYVTGMHPLGFYTDNGNGTKAELGMTALTMYNGDNGHHTAYMGGGLSIRDTATGTMRAYLTSDGLSFYDANGNLKRSYPAT